MALGFDYSSSGPRLDDRAREELRARAEEIVRLYLGEPNCRLSTSRELRWGRNGDHNLYYTPNPVRVKDKKAKLLRVPVRAIEWMLNAVSRQQQ